MRVTGFDIAGLLVAVLGVAGCSSQPLRASGPGLAATVVDAIVGVPVLTVVGDAARTAADDSDPERAAELRDAYDDFLRSRHTLERPRREPVSPIVISGH